VTWRHLVAIALVLVVGSLAQARAAQVKLASYREYPYGGCRFVQDQFGATPDKWQEELLVAAVNPSIQRISLQACAGPGKTCGLAWVGWLFQATRVSVDASGHYWHPRGLATSITKENLRDNLWAEFAHWQNRSEYLRAEFTHTAERIFHREHQATWYLAARTWPKSGGVDEQGRTVSGLHGRNVLVIVDESGSVPPTIMRAGEQALANTDYGLMIQAGNPISHEGMLKHAAMQAHLWHIIRVTGDPKNPNAWVNSPRVIASARPGQQTPAEWATEMIQTYGRDNPWVKAYILGEFPEQSINTLLSIEEVLAAQARKIPATEYAHMQKRLGIDVARFGDDRTVIFARQGLNTWVPNSPIVLRNAATTEIAARVYTAKMKWGSELEFIDDTGHWGHGVLDNLRSAGTSPQAVVFHGKASNPVYRNRRAEMWFRLAEAVKGGLNLPPHLGELPGELSAPTYTFVNGQQMLEDKDLIKKRLGRSPDLGDALALTFALPDQPGDEMKRLRDLKRAQENNGEWDPFATAHA
jgi:hypothetical protein